MYYTPHSDGGDTQESEFKSIFLASPHLKVESILSSSSKKNCKFWSRFWMRSCQRFLDNITQWWGRVIARFFLFHSMDKLKLRTWRTNFHANTNLNNYVIFLCLCIKQSTQFCIGMWPNKLDSYQLGTNFFGIKRKDR